MVPFSPAIPALVMSFYAAASSSTLSTSSISFGSNHLRGLNGTEPPPRLTARTSPGVSFPFILLPHRAFPWCSGMGTDTVVLDLYLRTASLDRWLFLDRGDTGELFKVRQRHSPFGLALGRPRSRN